MKVLVLTISDRASQGVYEDRSGPEIIRILSNAFKSSELKGEIISDSPDHIVEALAKNLDRDIIITTGGTGIGPRDHTPDITEQFCDRAISGIAEYLRRESCAQTLNAVLSRGYAGIKEKTIIINLPGSLKGAIFCTELLIPILEHAQKMVQGYGH